MYWDSKGGLHKTLGDRSIAEAHIAQAAALERAAKAAERAALAAEKAAERDLYDDLDDDLYDDLGSIVTIFDNKTLLGSLGNYVIGLVCMAIGFIIFGAIFLLIFISLLRIL